ncbi:MAG: YggT family protein [Acidimicrobiales bacterium]
MQNLLCALLQLYTYVLFIRAVLSWFPIRPDSGLVPVLRALDSIINPVLLPLRRVIPAAGMFDLSFLVLIVIVLFVHSAVCGGVGLLG